jgi:hypothetical protein
LVVAEVLKAGATTRAKTIKRFNQTLFLLGDPRKATERQMLCCFPPTNDHLETVPFIKCRPEIDDQIQRLLVRIYERIPAISGSEPHAIFLSANCVSDFDVG